MLADAGARAAAGLGENQGQAGRGLAGPGFELISAQTMTQRVLTGITTTGTLHLGNYVGPLLRWCQKLAVYTPERAARGIKLLLIHHSIVVWQPDLR